ncbi:MAG: tRNA-specific 2-thiouridylase, partial [Patescibacteria group bacterium]|nr:tRNA-specific 2-thiouridylase [Patescibacteria group bacterium]
LLRGADFVATGHYARLQAKSRRPQPHPAFSHPLPDGRGGEYKLLQAKDKHKDQTYFLCLLNQQQLRRALFPLGNCTKSEVRELAKKAKLPTADKPESMGICFVGEVKIDEFLRSRIKEKPGDIVSVSGEILGRHKGLPFYTIGQRKGLGVPGVIPWFVVAKELKTNRLVVVAGNKAPELYRKFLVLKNWHWVSKSNKQNAFHCKARIRHGQPMQSATFHPGQNPKVIFSKPQRAVTPGQYCAIYLHGELLGGGVIK